MTTLREASQQALEALESLFNWQVDHERGERCGDAVVALRAALAEPVQEPVAWMGAHDRTDLYYRKPTQADVVPLYTAPPQRKPLTEEEIQAAWDSVDMRHPRGNETRIAFARAIERAHGIT